MKRFLIPESGQFYKANLHSHSTVSDGTLTPAQMKELYKRHGYSVLSCTDHELMVPHHDLTDADFVMLTGFELGFDERWRTDFLQAKVCDLCLIAIDPDNVLQPCYHRTKYIPDDRRAWVKYDEQEPDFEREYNPDCINEAIRICRKKGFFVTYNHPHWSLERYETYTKYKGMHAMEICNFSSLIDGYNEYNGDVYDDLLHQDKRIFALGTDDNHNRRDPNCRMWDSFGAFTMIKAERLEYRCVTDALVKGHFYASQGPTFSRITLENGILSADFSPVVEAVGMVRQCCGYCANVEDFEGPGSENREITHLEVDLTKMRHAASPDYFRIQLRDKAGRMAWSNPVFLP